MTRVWKISQIKRGKHLERPLLLNRRGGGPWVQPWPVEFLTSDLLSWCQFFNSLRSHGTLFRAYTVTVFSHHGLQELAKGVETHCAVS